MLSPHAWAAFAVALLGGFALSGSRAAFSVQYPAMVADLGWSATQVTGAFSLGMPVYAAGLVCAGFAVDRFGIRSTLVTGIALLTASSLVALLADQLWQVYLSWGVLIALGQAGVGFVPVIKAAVTLAPARLGVSLGLFQLGQGLGLAAVTPAIALLDEHLGWRGAQAIATALLLATIPVASLIVPPARPPSARTPDAGAGRLPAIPVSFWPLLIAVIAFGLWFIVPVHQVAHLANVGFPGPEAAGFAGLTGIGGIVGGMALGSIIARLPSSGALLVSGGLMSLGTLALASITPGEPLLLAGYVVGVGLGRGAIGVTLSWLEGRLLPEATLGRMSALLETGIAFGALVGPLLAASWRDAYGTYVPGMALAAASAALIAVGGLATVSIAARAGAGRSTSQSPR